MAWENLHAGQQRLMDRWFGGDTQHEHQDRMQMVPTATLVEDPLAGAEQFVDLMAEAELGRPPTPPKLLASGGGVAAVGGVAVIDGRACCHDFLTRWNDELHKLRLPTTLECPTCKARWALGWKVRTRSIT